MHSEKNPDAFNQWASELACPVCLSALRRDERGVICTGCGRSFPVVDGIPILIAERAKQPDQ
jgi:uncharacterized protein YbaR (Trm112 family)